MEELRERIEVLEQQNEEQFDIICTLFKIINEIKSVLPNHKLLAKLQDCLVILKHDIQEHKRKHFLPVFESSPADDEHKLF